jgi:hypothetical protein
VGGLFHRSLDVVFQYSLRLLAGLVVIPLLTGGITLALDRSQTVATRVWADRPVFTPTFATDRFATWLTPAQVEASLMQEVIVTDAFVSDVLSKAEPGYEGWSGDHQEQAAADFRKRVSVEPQAQHLFVISYKTERPEYGIAVLKALLDVFSVTVQSLEAGQVTTAQNALQGELNNARQEMNTAVAQAQGYLASHQLNGRAPESDPNYSFLLGNAQTKTEHYLNIVAQIDEAQASHQAVVTIQASIFHVVDPPELVPPSFAPQSSPALRLGLIALGAVAVLEALFVYVVARRDPRVRVIEDVRLEVGLRPLGSAPLISSK